MTQKQAEYEQRFGKYWWTRWQIIRRHPDYRDFCDSWSFDFYEVKKRFGLKTIYHYSRDFSEQECFENLDIFDRGVVVRIWPEVNIDENGLHSCIPDSLPEYDNFIYLGINIADNTEWQEIEAEVRRTVIHARAVRGIRPNKTKFHADKDIFRVWDLHKEGKSATEIIKKLWPEEYQKGVGQDEDALEKKYKELFKRYGDEERAYNETYGTSGGDNIKLYVRVGDKKKKMRKMFQAY